MAAHNALWSAAPLLGCVVLPLVQRRRRQQSGRPIKVSQPDAKSEQLADCCQDWVRAARAGLRNNAAEARLTRLATAWPEQLEGRLSSGMPPVIAAGRQGATKSTAMASGEGGSMTGLRSPRPAYWRSRRGWRREQLPLAAAIPRIRYLVLQIRQRHCTRALIQLGQRQFPKHRRQACVLMLLDARSAAARREG